MSTKSKNNNARTRAKQGFEQARRAMKAGVKLGRKHGPVVARKTAAGLKQAGSAIRDSEHTKRLAKTVKKEVEKHPWLGRTLQRVSETTARVTKAAREHWVEKRYFEKSIKTLQEHVKRYPAIENAWQQTRHAFSMAPSSADKPVPATARRKKTTTRKKTATKKTAAKKKTTKKKTTKKKKTAAKKTSNRAA